MSVDWNFALARARAHSPFLKSAMRRREALVDLVARGCLKEALAATRQDGEADIGAALRKERLSLALVLGLGDLAGAFSLAEIMSHLSDFADRALDRAMRAAVAQRMPEADFAGLIGLALGKQGAGELNYSSDIDPILLYDPATLPHREREEAGEAAQRYARKTVSLLSELTGEGYVFRVDLRLRPASEASPLAVPVAGAIAHYASSALAWERAAFIRARAASGDILAGEAFLAEIRSFIWRRHLDFTAIEEIRRLTHRIRQSYAGPRDVGSGFDIKRGRGGIREAEFFAQTHQLIYGGRDLSLRSRGTRAALDALADAGIVARADAQMIGAGYDRLRQIEHRLQMVDDRQTHSLPETAAALDNVAHLDGLADGEALMQELREITGAVARCYDQLLGEPLRDEQAQVSVPDAFRTRFEKRAAQWHNTARSLRSAEARSAFGAIRGILLESLAHAPQPDRALARWETLLTRLPSAVNLFRLFEQRPGLLETVLRILTIARPLADELARRVELIDALIDASVYDLPEDGDGLEERMARCEEPDYERRLGRIRQVVGEQRFALGVQLIEGRRDPLVIGQGLCHIAEAAVITGAEAAIAEFTRAHGYIAGSEILVAALGRFGGGALTHSSDLDIVYLFTGEIGQESDGARPLSTSLYFNRLAMRITAALSVPTAEGALYEIDTRLRPQGRQGPIAVSLTSFARYQMEQAWTWEHMALCRSRAVFGSAEARGELTAITREVTQKDRDPAALRTDVLTMRAAMLAAKPARGSLDVKLMRGGLVDYEFLVHYLQLREGIGGAPAIEDAIARLSRRGFLSPGYGTHYLMLTRLLIAARLLAPDGEMPSTPQARDALLRACRADSHEGLLQGIAAAREHIAQAWHEHFDERLETDQ